MQQRRESPLKRTNPSGKERWVARYTNRDGARLSAGTFAKKGPCKEPVEGGGCCAQHAIDAAYAREQEGPRRAGTVGEYAATWTGRHPRTERTNYSYVQRVGYVLDVKIEDVPFRAWPMADIRRRHANALLDHMLREQKRAATGAQGVLRVLSAMWQDALDDEAAEANPFMGLRVKASDPRVEKAPRRIRVWSWEQMHGVCAAAGGHEAQLRVLSDCGVRLGELWPLERADLWRGECSDEDLPECKVTVPHLHVTKTAWRSVVSRGTKEDRLKAARGGAPWEVGRAVPVAPALLALLDGLPRRIDTRLLFPGPNGVWGDRYWRKQVWYPACKAAGVAPTPHEFRHSWISHQRAAGIDHADLAAMSGHTVETATRHYTHALGRSFEAAAQAVGA